jgi:hypothetical protein
MSDHDNRRQTRSEMDAASTSLIRDFGHLVPVATVIRQLARAREELLTAGVCAGLAHAAEAMARSRLMRIVPAHAASGPRQLAPFATATNR